MNFNILKLQVTVASSVSVSSNPEFDYTNEGQVCPIIVKIAFPENADKLIIYRVNSELWFPLNYCYTLHMIDQLKTGIKKLSLHNIQIDYNNHWVGDLFRVLC